MYSVVFWGRDRKPGRRERKFIQMAAEVDLWLLVDCCGKSISDFRSGWKRTVGQLESWHLFYEHTERQSNLEPAICHSVTAENRCVKGGQLANKREMTTLAPFVNITIASAGGNTSEMMDDTTAAQLHKHTNPMLFFYCSAYFFL